MSPMSRFLSIGMSVALISMIFYLIRRGSLREKYAIIWILTGITILFFAIFDKVLFAVTILFGIKTPINTMFFLGIFFIIAINLSFSLIVSSLVEQNKKIVQKLALLEMEIISMKQDSK